MIKACFCFIRVIIFGSSRQTGSSFFAELMGADYTDACMINTMAACVWHDSVHGVMLFYGFGPLIWSEAQTPALRRDPMKWMASILPVKKTFQCVGWNGGKRALTFYYSRFCGHDSHWICLCSMFQFLVFFSGLFMPEKQYNCFERVSAC